MSDWNWGDVPTWLTGISSTIALIGAFWAVREATGLRKIEQQRDDRHDSEQKMQQAALVAAWPEASTVEISNRGFNSQNYRHSPQVICLVSNGSELPIYDVKVEFVHSGRVLNSAKFNLIPPREIRQSTLPDTIYDSLVENGGSSAERTTAEYAKAMASEVSEKLRIRLSFKDAKNLIWLRDENGLLAPNN